MTRNTQAHFATNPTNIDISRSKFTRPSQHKTTFNTGDLVPIYVDEILPGDTAIMDMAAIIRMSTPIYPVMDNAFCDIYYFFVPNRLVWEHWREFNGQNNTTFWEQPTEYEVPQITSPSGGWEKGTIADYMGIPTKIEGLSINSMPFRAYCLIYNEWFRDENLKQPANINLDETALTGSNGGNYITDAQLGGKPCKAAKYPDYFTTALPEPQKGPDILMPLGSSAPVNGTLNYVRFGNQPYTPENLTKGGHTIWNHPGNPDQNYTIQVPIEGGNPNTDSTSTFIVPDKSMTEPERWYNELTTDLSQATGATINQLRQAFAIQRLYEKDARGGTRYTEIIRAHFGVISPDARQQRPEYLGGSRFPININQVVQTSSTDATTPQGNVSAYSLTGMNKHTFTKSFTEHGFIIGLAVVRTDHTYQQGLERMFSRRGRFDYYWPSLANIGEQAILNKEIYAQGTDADEEAFGYQEAWAEYRYKPNRVSGAFRSNYAQTLDSWHYADYYTSQPILGSTWIDETRENVNRTIAVQDELEDQFIADFYFKNTMVRPMPMYSIPGLIDHH